MEFGLQRSANLWVEASRTLHYSLKLAENVIMIHVCFYAFVCQDDTISVRAICFSTICDPQVDAGYMCGTKTSALS